MDTEVHNGSGTVILKLDLDKSEFFPADDGGPGLLFHALEVGDIKVARFVDERALGSDPNEGSGSLIVGSWRNSNLQRKMEESTAPLELIVELGVVGVSLVDHKPKELSYLYLERVFISYSTGYDGGTASRFENHFLSYYLHFLRTLLIKNVGK